MTLLLGIETSCDETAAAVVEDGQVVRASVVATQHELHEPFGGVVPEIASRAHIQRIAPTVRAAIEQAGVAWNQLDAIAVGNRPGLIGSLVVGVSAAQSLAWSLGLPLIGIDHVAAHLAAARLREPLSPRSPASHCGAAPPENNTRSPASHCGAESPHAALPPAAPPAPHLHAGLRRSRDEISASAPALGLVVSGGHTSLYHLHAGAMTRLGRTIDDAVGEAFDKAAVILGLGYPGGPAIERAAATGDPEAVAFPRSMLGKTSLDFSFSGLKTALLYAVRGKPSRPSRDAEPAFERDFTALTGQQRSDLAASFQAAAVDAVIRKVERALRHLDNEGQPAAALIAGGGVTANSHLRQRLQTLADREGLPLHLPALAYCVDNAAMIAAAAHDRFTRGEADDLHLPALATGSV
ncbi:MAG: tRNA (adenosine(37)-N6)-threonylcarbamoyltransferase complex transferase subunit TsaD [Phycisphaeraceae bacterium]